MSKNNVSIIKLGFFAALFFIVFSLNQAKAADEFDPNHIISDEEYLDSTTMSLGEIQIFLQSKNSYLAKYKCENYWGEMKTAAEIIYEAAADNYDCENITLNNSGDHNEAKQKCRKISINPKLLLVLLQKEQSLIEDQSPSQRALDWAVGYGCPDNQDCNVRWKGFGKQVNSAALQFYDYIANPNHYTYKAGGTYTVTNTNKPSMVITPVNQATAALYNYTPHVYNGNYNFHKLWLRYFTFSYTNNTLLQAKGEPGVWLIENGKKRAFLTRGALTSRFDQKKIVLVNKSDLDRYPTGDPIKFPQYSLVMSPKGNIFLLVDDKKRPIVSYEVFRKIGFNPEEIIKATWDEINTYEDGNPVTATSTYPTGALLQDKKTGGVFYVTEGTKAPIWDKIILKTKFKYRSITPVSPEKLASYTTVEPAIFGDSELIKTDGSPAVYIVENKFRRPFVSGALFEKLGYNWSNVINIPKKIIDLYPVGLPIAETPSEEDNATSTIDSMATTTPSSIGTASSTNNNLSSTTSQELNDILNPGN